MKVLIQGLGSIARRHIQNIKIINPDASISVLRQRSKSDPIQKELNPVIENIFVHKEDALIWKPDIVFVTNPAPFHVESAIPFVRQGSHVFIEKPLSTSLKDIDFLLEECRTQKIILMVGYVLRFLKPLKIIKQLLMENCIGKVLYMHSAVGQYLCDWRSGTDYRISVSAQKKLGGGVLFELSHELDILRWFLGEVQTIHAASLNVSDLELDVEDTAEIILKFRSGALGSAHLDMVDHVPNRSCRIVGAQGTLTWDAQDHHKIKIYRTKTKEWKTEYSDSKLDLNEAYLEEIKHFFKCVDKGIQPLISGEDGKKVLELILAAKQSAQKGREIFV